MNSFKLERLHRAHELAAAALSSFIDAAEDVEEDNVELTAAQRELLDAAGPLWPSLRTILNSAAPHM